MSKQEQPKRTAPAGGMGRGPGGVSMMPGEKPKDFKGTLKKLVTYLSAYKIRLFFVFIFAVASTIFMIVGPKILGNATTAIFEGVMNMIADNGKGIDFNYIGQIILLMLALYLISVIFSYMP